jgi:phenylacetate-coenzyme A ligase PaaK-like adenylate-forming protein
MVLLATEQAAGRLALRPTVVLPGGECLSAADRAAIEAAFGCPVYESYGTAELGMVGYGCRAGWLHVNADWTILEPVDDDYRPVPPGQPSHTVLATNLANRIQPIIRYDQGDSITVRPDPCPCGSRLPAILVEGRHYETLYFDGSDRRAVPLLPQAVLGTVTATPGVERAQVVQTSPTALRVRFEARPGFDDGSVWDAITGRLGRFFSEHGVGGTQLIRSTEPPIRDPVSGKLPRIVTYARSAAR